MQLKLLSLIARDQAFISEHRDAISPSYFDFDTHVTLARLILDHYDHYKTLPTYTTFYAQVQDYIRDNRVDTRVGERMLETSSLLYALDSEDVDFGKDKALEFARNQQLKTVLVDIVDMMQQGGVKEENHEAIREKIGKALAVGENGLNGLGLNFFEELPKIHHLVSSEGRYNRGKTVKTLLPSLDDCLIGGIGAGQLGCIIAPPKRGKSTFLVNLGAAALHQKKNVVHVTFELNEADVALRYAARLTGTSMNDIIMGRNRDEYFSKIDEFMKFQNALRIKYERPNCATVGWIRNYLNKVTTVAGVKPDLVIVDYGDLIKKKYETEIYISAGVVYQELIALAADFQVPVWTASQAGRQSMEANHPVVGIADVAESWKKVADADVILSLNQSAEDKQQGKMMVYVAAVRRGSDEKRIYCNVDYAKCHIYEPEDTPALKPAPAIPKIESIKAPGVLTGV